MKVNSFALFLASASHVQAWAGGSWSNSTTIQAYPCLTETQLNAQVPACAQSCQQAALAADGCDDYEDVACHCAATGAIGLILTPCLASSSCSSDDLTALQNLITPICTYFNATSSGVLEKPVCNAAAPTSALVASGSPVVSPPPAVSNAECAPAITQTTTIWVKPSIKPSASVTASPTAVSQPIKPNGTYTGPVLTGTNSAGGRPTVESVVVFVGFVAVWVL